MDAATLQAVGLTLQVALAATILVWPLAVGLAWLLARRRFFGRDLLAALVGVPLVLPPTAVGYLLLRLLAAKGPVDRVFPNLEVLLTPRAAVLAAAVMALPLIVRTARVAFEDVDPRLEGVSRTLGLGPLETFLRVTLPLAGRGLAAATILGFTRALGEYGATVMIAGSIPGRTRTLASAIDAAQRAGRDDQAHALLLIALLVGVVAIIASERLVRGRG